MAPLTPPTMPPAAPQRLTDHAVPAAGAPGASAPAAHESSPHVPPLARLRGVSWRHWLREVAVIAAGALAALAAQAWWQDRQDREREADYLRQLLADTRENERRLGDAVKSDSLAARAQAHLADVAYGTGPLPPADTLIAYVAGNYSAFSGSDFKPVTGTLTALLTTGDLRLIRNEALRARLVAYAARLESGRESLRFSVQEGVGVAGRVVRAFPFMRRVFANDPRVFAAEVRRFDFARLRADPEVAAVLFSLQAGNANRLGLLKGMRYDTRELRRALEAQLTQPTNGRPPTRDSAPRPPR